MVMFIMAIGFFLIIWGIPLCCFFYFACRNPPQRQNQEPQNEEPVIEAV